MLPSLGRAGDVAQLAGLGKPKLAAVGNAQAPFAICRQAG